MTPSQASAPGKPAPRRPRASGTTLAAFLVGLPLAAGILCFIHFGTLPEEVKRYISHNVERVEVVLFCCAVSGLAAKLWRWRTERRACRTEVLPSWDGQPVPVAEGLKLLAAINRLPNALQGTYLVKRIIAVLDFLNRRASAADLDDQLRALADNDAVALENSYSLIRLITWAIPILGFLGTVLGITGAISGVNPETLEQSLSSVTDGLAEAFDSTALALGLTMATMFFSFLVERAEQSVLESVDAFVDRHLAHRFERAGAEGGPFVEVVAQNTQVLLRATEQLVQRQAEVWARTQDEVNRRQAEAEKHQQERLTAALEAALERTLQSHAQRAAALEKQAVDQSGELLKHLAALARAVRDTGKEQQAGLGRIAEGLAAQAEALARLQDGEKQLLRLQEVLNQNLAALAGAGAFEEAVHALTAAVHLLTTRTGAPPLKSTAAAGRGAAA
jgi:biopolymer transport protein ExbB/TolQ